MSNPETAIVQQIRLTVGGLPAVRLFRNSVGVARFPNGTAIPYGLCVGSSDLIGWRSVRILPHMVGKYVAVFTAIEVKTPEGRATPEQSNFILAVRKAGGMAGIATSPTEAMEIVNERS